MHKKHLLISVATLLIAQAAAAMPADFPQELMYQQKPIDPMCFEEVEGATHTALLEECGVSAEKGRHMSGYTDNLLRQGYTGYDYKEKDTGPVAGYSYYKVIGKLNGGELIYTINSGGGSGEFTALRWVTRKGDTLTVETLNQGDRCNNGIENAVAGKGEVTYQVNMTPYDFFVLTNDNPHHLRAYDDLPACAACCAAKAIFSRPLDKNYQKEKLVAVDFSHYSLNPTDDPNATRYQLCFNKLISESKAKGQTAFNSQELHAFTKNFNQVCFKK